VHCVSVKLINNCSFNFPLAVLHLRRTLPVWLSDCPVRSPVVFSSVSGRNWNRNRKTGHWVFSRFSWFSYATFSRTPVRSWARLIAYLPLAPHKISICRVAFPLFNDKPWPKISDTDMLINKLFCNKLIRSLRLVKVIGHVAASRKELEFGINWGAGVNAPLIDGCLR